MERDYLTFRDLVEKLVHAARAAVYSQTPLWLAFGDWLR